MANTITGEAGVGSYTEPSAVGTGSTVDAFPNSATTQSNPDQALLTDRNKLTQYTLDQLQRLRNFRRPYDQRRSYFYRQYVAQRDRRMFPDNLTPRSNTFVPYPSSNVDTVTSRVHDAFFSIDPPIEVRSKGGTDYQAQQMQMVLLSSLKRAKWIKQLEMMIRDCAIYGHAGIKIDWDWDFDTVTGPEPVYAMQPVTDSQGQPVLDPKTGQPFMLPITDPMTGDRIQTGVQVVTKQVPRNCPKIIPIDIYDLLVDPDEKIVGHVQEISYGELKRMCEAKPDLYYPEAIAELTARLAQYRDLDRDGIIIRMAEMWDDTKKNVTIVSFGEDADAIGWKDRRYQYRNASYSAYKRRVYNGPPVLLYTGPNPFAHQRMPIIHLPYIKVKGDTYGIGLIERISDLTEAVNVYANMITDNWNIGINKRYAYNVEADIDHDSLNLSNVPGGKVGVVGDPNAAIMPFPSFTPNQQDYMIIDLYKGMIEMSSGISDYFGKGVGDTGGNRTAAGISQVINETGYIFKLFIRNFELEVLQPLCEMTASMIQQYGTPELEYSVTNAPPGIPTWGRVRLEDLVGNYSFDFLGANYATGKVVKQRNLMAFYSIAMQSPYAVQGEFLREIARAMEIPNANRLMKSDQQVMQESQQQQNAAMQTEILRELMKFEGKALVAGIGKQNPPVNTQPSAVTNHALETQKLIEQYLAEQAGLPDVAPPGAHNHEGQGPTGNLETPGGDIADHMRSFAQQNGGNTMGAG